ncbi:MAG: EamA family transporter [Candidatus Latescibacteria bacterium]|nr:EamA family transporter [Candidatus Latescibacterota bacterium]
MPLQAFVLVMISTVLHAAWNFAVRRVSGNLAVLWVGMWFAVIVSLPLVCSVPLGPNALTAGWPYVAATGLAHTVYFLMLAKAYEEGEISVVYPLARGTGVGGTALAAWILIDERLTIPGTIGIATVVLGIILLGVTDVRTAKNRRSIAYALLVGATIAVYSVVDKLGVSYIHPVHYVFSLFLIPGVLLSPYVLLRQRAAVVLTWRELKRYALWAGPGSMATYLLVLFAMRLGKVSYILAVREFSVVIGASLGVLYLGERFGWDKAAGIGAIVLGLALVKLGG